MDVSPLRSGRDLLKGKMQVLHEREEVIDWMSRRTVVAEDRPFKGLERFSPILSENSFNHCTLLHPECFDKVRLDDFPDNSLNIQPVSLIGEARNQTKKVCEGNPEKILITGVPVDSEKMDCPQDICDQTSIENMETEEVADHREIKITKNYPSKVNANQITTARAPNDKQGMANLRTGDDHPSMENKDDAGEFNFGHQKDQRPEAASGQI